ncbi:MAG: hypothetical protein PVG89_04845 [Gammaproteobacteria bacterium]|jgi:hypothetical protein
MLRKFVVCIISLCFGMSWAQAASLGQAELPTHKASLDLRLPDSTKQNLFTSDEAGYKVAMSPAFLSLGEQQSMEMTQGSTEMSEGGYEDRMFTANKIHKYLGIGSIGAALLAVISPKEEDGAHEAFAKTSAALGLGAVATGLVFHWEDIGIQGGFSDPDNLHALFAGLGALGLAAAASEGPESPHATYGSLGAISMMVGIKYTW